MNWLDFVLLILLGISFVAGLAKGFTRAAVGLAALVLGVFCGLWFYGIPASWFREYLASDQLAHLLGFLIIFVGFLVLGGMVAWGLAKALKVAQLSWLDRLAGGAFGILRGVLVGAVIITVVMAFAAKAPPQSVAGSRLAPYVMHGARVIVAAAPRQVKDGFANSYGRLKEIWGHAVQKDRRPAAQNL